MTTTNKNGLVIIQADSDKVLCDGYTKTSVGGKITAKEDTDLTEWQEMNEAEADALIAKNIEPEEPGEDLTEIEEKAKAYDIIMGVTGNE